MPPQSSVSLPRFRITHAAHCPAEQDGPTSDYVKNKEGCRPIHDNIELGDSNPLSGAQPSKNIPKVCEECESQSSEGYPEDGDVATRRDDLLVSEVVADEQKDQYGRQQGSACGQPRSLVPVSSLLARSTSELVVDKSVQLGQQLWGERLSGR